MRWTSSWYNYSLCTVSGVWPPGGVETEKALHRYGLEIVWVHALGLHSRQMYRQLVLTY